MRELPSKTRLARRTSAEKIFSTACFAGVQNLFAARQPPPGTRS
jgi:hypothetical protein